MNEPSFFAKLLCAAALAAGLGWAIPEALGGLLTHSAATEVQIFYVKGSVGLMSACIGGWLGWANAQLIITGAIFSAAADMFLGIFSP